MPPPSRPPCCPVLTCCPRRRLERELATRRAALNPMTEQEQHLEAGTLRGVSRPQPLPAGMAFLEVLGPAEDVHLLHTVLTSIAGMTKDAATAAARRTGIATAAARSTGTNIEVEGIDAHRFDALINLAAGALADGQLPTRHGKRARHRDHDGAVHPARPRRPPGRSGRLRPHHRRGRAPRRRRPHRHLAAAHHRPERPRHRRRVHQLPAAAGSLRHDRRPGPDLHLPPLRPPRYPAATSTIRTPGPSGSTSLHNNHALCRGHHNLKTAGIVTPQYDPGTGDTSWTLSGGHAIRRPAYLSPPVPEPPPEPPCDSEPEGRWPRAPAQHRRRVARRYSGTRRGRASDRRRSAAVLGARPAAVARLG